MRPSAIARTARHRTCRASPWSAAAGRRGCRCCEEGRQFVGRRETLHTVDRVARSAPAGAGKAEAAQSLQRGAAELAEAEHADAARCLAQMADRILVLRDGQMR